jgi:membrane protease subunit (stomatin/prohibitin family)
MGIMDFFSKQFIDVIQWTEEEAGTLAYRYPMQDMEIQNGAQLVVRETQKAVFLNEGKLADSFEAGTHTLSTNTLPILTYLKNWDKFFESPFKSDVYYFSTREQTDQKWGTTQPITIRDKEFGVIRLRAFGSYSYCVEDTEQFFKKLVGTAERYSVADAEGQLRASILTSLASFLGKSEIAFIDMAANQEAFSQQLREACAGVFSDYGLSLKTFFVSSLSLPEELEKHLDRASSMRMVGDLQRYTQFQAADSISAAAENPGGAAGAGAGMGAGFAMGQMMMGAMANATSGSQAAPAAQPGEDPIVMLEKLGGLLSNGILTQEEFNQKKAELLAKIK